MTIVAVVDVPAILSSSSSSLDVLPDDELELAGGAGWERLGVVFRGATGGLPGDVLICNNCTKRI